MKIAVLFANIFMAETEKRLIQQSETKPKGWKRYINDVFSLRDCHRKEVNQFIKRANYFHPTIKFTSEISENQPNHFSRYRGVQRGKIRKKFNLGHQNSLEADRDFPNYALRLVSTLPLDNRHINIHKNRKVTKVYCLSSQRTTRQLKFKTNIDGKMESDTQSALAENRFYKTSDHF